uniref:Uncharacterized protein n=1 Tax=Rhizophora mucronata TaxID=61149 RepID=A0A2P2IJI2_RHIMU
MYWSWKTQHESLIRLIFYLSPLVSLTLFPSVSTLQLCGVIPCNAWRA